MITFLLVVHALIAAALVTVILMQRSEGGGLGMGGSPSGLMSARGAADFLTRATSVLATLFVLMAFLIATLASHNGAASKIDTSLSGQAPAGPITAPAAPAGAIPGIPMMGGAPDTATAKALQPSAAGLPGAQPAPGAPRPAAPQPVPAPVASSLKTIDTSATSGKASIGINGVTTTHAAAVHGGAAKPAAAPVDIAPPAAPSAPAAGTPAAGNGATPQ